MPRGPLLVTTTVGTLSDATLPSSNVTTIALLPFVHVDDEVIWLTVCPTNASP